MPLKECLLRELLTFALSDRGVHAARFDVSESVECGILAAVRLDLTTRHAGEEHTALRKELRHRRGREKPAGEGARWMLLN